LLSTLAVKRTAEPSMNVTVPVGVFGPGETVTVAVKTTMLAEMDG